MKKNIWIVLPFVMLVAANALASGVVERTGDAQGASSPARQGNGGARQLPRDMTLEEMRRRAHERAEKLDHMSEAQWEQVRKNAALHGGRAANMTLRQAQENTHTFAKRLDAMTPQQWDDFKNRMEARQASQPQHATGGEPLENGK